MQLTANRDVWEWFLSPFSDNPDDVSGWYSDGYVGWSNAGNRHGVRGVLNLKSQAMIESNHEGSKTDPYVVIEQ